MSYFARSGKDPLPKSASKVPIHKIKADASFGGKTDYHNLKFFNYISNRTFCGNHQVLFRLNHHAADYIPKATFHSPIFENIHQDAMAFLFTPPDEWANLDDCGDFPCTAPSNALLDFEDATWKGPLKPTKTDPEF